MEPLVRTTPELLGKHLSMLRARKGWDQKKAASEAGIHFQTLRNLEEGSADPQLSTLEGLANAYGVTLSAIFEPWQNGSAAAPARVLNGRAEIILERDPTQFKSVELIVNLIFKSLKR